MLCKAAPTTEEALTSRLLQSTIHTLELYGIYLGKELGLYAGSRRSSLTPPELATQRASRRATPANGSSNRRSRDCCRWNSRQLLPRSVVLAAGRARERAGRQDHPAHLAPLAQMVAGIGGALDRVVAAYRTGGGVAVSANGDGVSAGPGRHQSARVPQRPGRTLDPAAADLHRGAEHNPLRVADVGCGAGWSTIAVARAYPRADVIGFDTDEASIADARRNTAGRRAGPVRSRDAAARRLTTDRSTWSSSSRRSTTCPVPRKCCGRCGERCARRQRDCRGRKGRRSLSRARRRDRASHVRLEHRALPAGRDGGVPVGRHRHGDARRHRSGAGGCGRLCPRRSPAGRWRFLPAVSFAAALSPGSAYVVSGCDRVPLKADTRRH